MNYLDAMKRDYLSWMKVNTPQAYAKVISLRGSRLAGEDQGFWGGLFDTVKSAGGAIFSSANEYQKAKLERERMAAEARQRALEAQRAAIGVIEQRDLARQAAELARIQQQASDTETDNTLLYGGLFLAAIAAAKVMKII